MNLLDSKKPPLLGVNIDHVATLREARGEGVPSVLDAAFCVVRAGADSITIHLREDRRHIQYDDLRNIRQHVPIPLNLEMSATQKMLEIAIDQRPDYCCLVPENRAELTTEGGLDVHKQKKDVGPIVSALKNHGVRTAIFVDPDPIQIHACLEINVDAIEIHTGHYANHPKDLGQYQKIKQAAQLADKLGIEVHAGHGLNYQNVSKIISIRPLQELNIGHAIISYALFYGLEKAVQYMKHIIIAAHLKAET